MSFEGGKTIWLNGRMVPWEDASIHVMAHALHYGSSVFEGIRMYKTPDGPKIFRLSDHMQRLYDSAKIYRMPIPYELGELIDVCKAVVIENNLTDGAYIRPIALRGYGDIGLAPKPDHPVDVAIAAWRWGAYLGNEALEQGVDVCISSWQRRISARSSRRFAVSLVPIRVPEPRIRRFTARPGPQCAGTTMDLARDSLVAGKSSLLPGNDQARTAKRKADARCDQEPLD